MDSGRSGGLHVEAKQVTAPSHRPESLRATVPRAGSEARRCGVCFGNGVGEGERARIAATVAERSGAWTGAARETRRSEDVVDSAGDRVGALGKSGNLAQGCAERVQIIAAGHGETSKTPQQKAATNNHKRLSVVEKAANHRDHSEDKPSRLATNTRKSQMSAGRCGCACFLSRTVVITVVFCETNHLHLMVSKKSRINSKE